MCTCVAYSQMQCETNIACGCGIKTRHADTWILDKKIYLFLLFSTTFKSIQSYHTTRTHIPFEYTRTHTHNSHTSIDSRYTEMIFRVFFSLSFYVLTDVAEIVSFTELVIKRLLNNQRHTEINCHCSGFQQSII